eukprot:3377061-Pyramimonas_sp.AAC.1
MAAKRQEAFVSRVVQFRDMFGDCFQSAGPNLEVEPIGNGAAECADESLDCWPDEEEDPWAEELNFCRDAHISSALPTPSQVDLAVVLSGHARFESSCSQQVPPGRDELSHNVSPSPNSCQPPVSSDASIYTSSKDDAPGCDPHPDPPFHVPGDLRERCRTEVGFTSGEQY